MGRKKTSPRRESSDRPLDLPWSSVQERDAVVLSYLESLNSTQVRDLFAVEVSTIKKHWSSNPQALKILSNALAFAEDPTGLLTRCLCFICKARFPSFNSFTLHLYQRHVALYSSEFQLIRPQRVDALRAEVISNDCWKPIDAPAAMEMLQRQPQCLLLGLRESWPTSNDPDRTKLLKKIKISLQILLKSNLLFVNQLDLLLEFATRALENLPCSSTLLNIGGSNLSHVFICFLGAKKLESIFKVLQEVCKSSETDSLPDGPVLRIPGNEVVQRAFLDQDSSILVLETSFAAKGGMGVFSADALLSWLYYGPSSEDSSSNSSEMVMQMKEQTSKIHDALSEKVLQLNSLQAQKFCLEVAKKTKNDVEPMAQQLKTSLMKWKEKLAEMAGGKNDAVMAIVSAAARELEEENEEDEMQESNIIDNYGLRMQDNLDQQKSHKTMLFHRQNELYNRRLDKINARMMKNLGSLSEIEHKLHSASMFSYLTRLNPLVKPCLMASIEKSAKEKAQAYESAAERAQAAYESLMAEENVARRSTKSGGSDKKQAKKKLKDKKDKDSKKFKGRKNVGCSEQSLPQEASEQQEVLTATYGDLVKTEHDRKGSHMKKIEEEDRAKNLEAVMPMIYQHIGDQSNNVTMHLEASSGASRAQENLSGILSPELSSSEDDDVALTNDPISNIVIANDFLGTGLKNEVGEYNCFLNVVIQSLWHIRRFRDEFHRTSSMHKHVGDPCVTCALSGVFADLINSSEEAMGEPIDPAPLRLALSNLHPGKFQMTEMGDASEVLQEILDCLHRSFTSSDCNTNLGGIDYVGAGNCKSNNCIAHTLFGMELRDLKNQKYTAFCHLTIAAEWRGMKNKCADRSFDELSTDIEIDHLQSEADAESSGVLSTPPHIFTIVLGLESDNEGVEKISATLDAITTEVDIGTLYSEFDQGSKHQLVAMVCYGGLHYICFAYSAEHGNWIMYNDQTIKVSGSWNDVCSSCKRELLHPTILFFEAVQ